MVFCFFWCSLLLQDNFLNTGRQLWSSHHSVYLYFFCLFLIGQDLEPFSYLGCSCYLLVSGGLCSGRVWWFHVGVSSTRWCRAVVSRSVCAGQKRSPARCSCFPSCNSNMYLIESNFSDMLFVGIFSRLSKFPSSQCFAFGFPTLFNHWLFIRYWRKVQCNRKEHFTIRNVSLN